MRIAVNDQIELKDKDDAYAKTKWQVSVEILLVGKVSTEDATVLHEAINSISTVAEKYKPGKEGDDTL